MKALIEQLDTPQRAGGNMFIVYLRNADAARVAETLRGLFGGGGGGPGAGGRADRRDADDGSRRGQRPR